jgi:hypothetical protein
VVRLTGSGPFLVHRTRRYFLGQFFGVTSVLQPIANVFVLSFSLLRPLPLWHLDLLSGLTGVAGDWWSQSHRRVSEGSPWLTMSSAGRSMSYARFSRLVVAFVVNTGSKNEG